MKIVGLKVAANLAKSDKVFIGSVFGEYKNMLDIDDEQLIYMIRTVDQEFTEDDFYKLCLFGVPNIYSAGGDVILCSIANCCGINSDILRSIVSQVFSTNSKGEYKQI